MQATTRLFAPYAWGAISDRTGERVKLLRIGAAVAFASACLLFLDWGPVGLGLVLLVMFTHTSSMMPMSEAAMAHLVSQGGAFDTKRYGRVRLWGSLGFLVTVFAAGAWFEAFGMQHFPGWTVLSLGAVLLSVWFFARPQGGGPHLEWPCAGVACFAAKSSAVVFCRRVFFMCYRTLAFMFSSRSIWTRWVTAKP